MNVRPITYGSAEYRTFCELRHRFLREPLGLSLSDADVAGEESQHHYGLFTDEPSQGGRLVGGVIGKPDPDDASTVRIRQMVVDADFRTRGLGRTLMLGAEADLAKQGFHRVILFARDEAYQFYERCGYIDTGENAKLIGLPHRRMRKTLG